MSNHLAERRRIGREPSQGPEDMVEIALGYPDGMTLTRPLVNKTTNGFAFKLSTEEGTFLPGTPLRIRRFGGRPGESGLIGRVCHSSCTEDGLALVGVEILVGREDGARSGDRFVFSKTIYLTDTNALGNAYFARYFDWQGMAREEFLRRLLPDPMGFFGAGNKFFTVKAETEYKSGLSLYDEVEIEIRTANIRRMSFDFVFFLTHKSSGQLVARGRQRFCVMSKESAFAPIPREMRSNLLRYKIPTGQEGNSPE